MLTTVINFFKKLRWSVTIKISLCLAVLVAILFSTSSLVIFAIQSQESNSAIERQKNTSLIDIEIFDKLLGNTLSIYNDAIYLSQTKAPVNKKYQTEVLLAFEKVKANNSEQLTQPDSLVARIVENTRQLENVFNQANTLLQNAQNDEVVVLWASALDLRRTLTNQTKELHDQIERQQSIAAQNSQQASSLTKTISFIAGLLGSLFAVFCAWLLSATIGKPLAVTRKFLEGIAAGDFSSQLKLENRDELGDLARVLNVSVSTLRGIVESFNIGAQVEIVARNLRFISSDQVNYSSDQVERITQIGTALQELTSFAQSINENATMVANAASTTLTQAQQVNVITTQVGEIMQRLQITVAESDTATLQANNDFSHLTDLLYQLDNQSRSTQAVVNITADIAKKIHLLSLNASIEAAGAGQSGERFRQVASQIKELAVHSATSAKDINDLLLSIRNSIQETVGSSEQSRQSLNEVVGLSKKAALLARETSQVALRNREAVQEILTASAYSAQQAAQIKNSTQQQQLSSQQILTTVGTISQIIRLTAQRSNEVADTSIELNAMSESLASRLAALKLPALTTN